MRGGAKIQSFDGSVGKGGALVPQMETAVCARVGEAASGEARPVAQYLGAGRLAES